MKIKNRTKLSPILPIRDDISQKVSHINELAVIYRDVKNQFYMKNLFNNIIGLKSLISILILFVSNSLVGQSEFYITGFEKNNLIGKVSSVELKRHELKDEDGILKKTGILRPIGHIQFKYNYKGFLKEYIHYTDDAIIGKKVYKYDKDNALINFRDSSWVTIDEFCYKFNKIQKSIVIIGCNGNSSLIKREINFFQNDTVYEKTFYEDKLIRTDTYIYDKKKLLQHKQDEGRMIYLDTYKYDKNNNKIEMTRSINNEIAFTNYYEYKKFDKIGNWTECIESDNRGYITLNHRIIKYYK